MTQYIDKNTLMAAIEKLQLCTMDEHMDYYSTEAKGEYNAFSKLKSFLNVIEVKEVDLDREIETYLKECLNIKFPTTDIELIKKDAICTAKHFFELGLKAQKGE